MLKAFERFKMTLAYYLKRKENKHVKEINFGHKHAGLDPHVHHGYFHNENDGKKGATRLTKEEKKMVESVKKVWHDYLSRR